MDKKSNIEPIKSTIITLSDKRDVEGFQLNKDDFRDKFNNHVTNHFGDNTFIYYVDGTGYTEIVASENIKEFRNEIYTIMNSPRL